MNAHPMKPSSIERRGGAPLRFRLAGLAPPRPISVPPAPAGRAASGVLHTSRMILRPLFAEDAPEFLRVLRLNREHLSRFFPPAQDAESDTELFARHAALSRFDGPGAPDWRRAAFSPDGRLIGEFNLNAITRGLEFRAEATWWVSREFTRRGYATEGVRVLLDLAFREIDRGGLGLHRVDALIAPDNVASRRVAEKLGLRQPVRPVRLVLDAGPDGLHELYHRFVELPAAQIEAKPLAGGVLARVHVQLQCLQRMDPGQSFVLRTGV